MMMIGGKVGGEGGGQLSARSRQSVFEASTKTQTECIPVSSSQPLRPPPCVPVSSSHPVTLTTQILESPPFPSSLRVTLTWKGTKPALGGGDLIGYPVTWGATHLWVTTN